MGARDCSQGKFDEAKLPLERAIQIGENTLRPEHPSLATSLNNFARLLSEQVSLVCWRVNRAQRHVHVIG